VARIKCGLAHELRLGNVHAARDWGFAGDYVQAMWLMLQQPEPDDYVIGTGTTHTVQEVVEVAFASVGLHWGDYVRVDIKLFRPAEVDRLCANPTKAKHILGWVPQVSFIEMVERMVGADIERLVSSDKHVR
jgi:GDPmannose 4,6-dehydratase